MRAPLILLAAAALLCGCGGGGHGQPARRSPAPRRTPAASRPAGPAPRLTGRHRCLRRLKCATLPVPLDHSGAVAGRLALRVVFGPPGPRGVLVLLTGGPGQPGVPFIKRLSARLRAVTRGYRLVMFDQRGTGGPALRCPALQREMGASDLTPPAPAAVLACAARIGPDRRFYSTADTVADLEDLRVALHAPKLTLDGVSYGTFVAERYALAHPDRTARLVLDSVVPHAGYDPLDPVPLEAARRVMALVCRACPREIAAIVRRYHDGPQILDLLTSLSIGVPRFGAIPRVLRAAAAGRPAALRRLSAAVHRAEEVPAPVLSQGLHAATLCADDPSPWGGPATPPAGRRAALLRAARRVPAAALAPFDRATLIGTGTLLTCLSWPPTPAPAVRVAAKLPPVPTLLLAGDRDLSTPLEWARREAALAPNGKLVVVPGAGHGLQSRAADPAGRLAAVRFLHAG